MPRKKLTPQEKKLNSLLKDRRNTYGENAKASRKNIPRRKAVGSRMQRRIAKQILIAAAAAVDPEIVDSIEPRLKKRRLAGWAKVPDQPLGVVIARKRKNRAASVGRKKKHRSADK